MNKNAEAIASTISPDFSHCQNYLTQLQQQLEDLDVEIKRFDELKFYSPEVKKRMVKIEQKKSELKNTITEVEKMIEFPPGAWVRNGTTKPGKVVNLVIAGAIPEVHVRWWGATVPVPERPLKLTLVKPEDLEYIWNGDRVPKLVRRIDQHECDEIEVLEHCLQTQKTCKDLAISGGSSVDIVNDHRLKVTYCRKRIAWVNKQDLTNLEHTIKQGLKVFYRVGEALLQIRDRKLYRDLGYSSFKDYCFERWNMGKSQAYRLIESTAVVNNLKSVPHGGQNLASAYETNEQSLVLPMSERVTRELAKLPPEKQAAAWEMALKTSSDNEPTAAHTKRAVAEILEVSPSEETSDDQEDRDDDHERQIDKFSVGQIVQIQSDRTDKRLVGYNGSVGLVTQVNPASVDLKTWGQTFSSISPNDLTILGENNLPAICVVPSVEDYRLLLSEMNSKEEIIKAAIAARRVKN